MQKCEDGKRGICIFVEQRDTEQERQGWDAQVTAGLNDVEVNKLPSPSQTVKGGSCPISGVIN